MLAQVVFHQALLSRNSSLALAAANLKVNFEIKSLDSFQDNQGNSIPDTDSHFTQLQVGVEVNYVVEELVRNAIFLPYVGVMYGRDLASSGSSIPGAPSGDNEIEINVGAVIYGTSPWSGLLDFTTTQGRKDISSYMVVANVRYRF